MCKNVSQQITSRKQHTALCTKQGAFFVSALHLTLRAFPEAFDISPVKI